MITKLEFKIKESEPETYNYNMGSLFHGVLMEVMSSRYADYLHSARLLPYSQTIVRKNGGVYWQVNTLNQEAYQQIIIPLLEKKDCLVLKKRKQELKFENFSVNSFQYQDLIEKKCVIKNKMVYKIKILTPLSFKIKGSYSVIPDLNIIYRNIMNRFDACSETIRIYNANSLDYVTHHSRIMDYSLKTTRFFIERSTIPGIVGEMVVEVSGEKDMQNFVGVMFDYAQYSGIGIKTSIGMGGTKLVK